MKGFEERTQYYAAKAYNQQFMKEEEHIRLKEIIFIAITDFIMFEKKLTYYSNHYILDGEDYT